MSDTLEAKLKTNVIVSGLFNLSQAFLWLGVFCLIWPSSLHLLKVIAIMWSGLNVLAFCAFVLAWLGVLSYMDDTNYRKYELASGTLYCTNNVLFGLTKWLFVMNYLALAYKL